MASALSQWGDHQKAKALCDEAIAFDPNAYGLWSARGMLIYPGNGAVEDFREAVRLGDRNCYPYYFLAHSSLMTRTFQEAAEWCREALKRGPSLGIKAQLHLWLAIAAHESGVSLNEVLALLAKAREIDPENVFLKHDVEEIQAQLTAATSKVTTDWTKIKVAPVWEEFTESQESIVIDRRNRLDLANQKLETVSR